MLSVPRSGVRRRSDGLVGIGRVLAHRVLPPVSWRHKIGGSVVRRRSQAAYRIGPKSADERQDRKTPQLKRFSQETDKVHMGAWATMRPHVDTGRPLRIGRSCSGCRLREPARSGKGRGVAVSGSTIVEACCRVGRGRGGVLLGLHPRMFAHLRPSFLGEFNGSPRTLDRWFVFCSGVLFIWISPWSGAYLPLRYEWWRSVSFLVVVTPEEFSAES